MGVRWLVCNVRNGTRWLYRGYTWQRLVQSSVQSIEGAPCRAPPKALPEALPEALHGAPSKPCTELPQSSTRSSLKGAYSSASVAESSGSAGQGAKTSASCQEKTRRYRKFFNF